MILFLPALLAAQPAAPAPAPPRVRVEGDRLLCVSGGSQTATVLAIPPGITRFSGRVRRTVGRPGGLRVAGASGGFALRIGIADAANTTLAGLFARSGPAEEGPPRVADHFFTMFGRYRHGTQFEFAQRSGDLARVAIPGDDGFRFDLQVVEGGSVRVHMAWQQNGESREAGGLVPGSSEAPAEFVIQCEVDDFAVEEIRLG